MRLISCRRPMEAIWTDSERRLGELTNTVHKSKDAIIGCRRQQKTSTQLRYFSTSGVEKLSLMFSDLHFSHSTLSSMYGRT